MNIVIYRDQESTIEPNLFPVILVAEPLRVFIFIHSFRVMITGHESALEVIDSITGTTNLFDVFASIFEETMVTVFLRAVRGGPGVPTPKNRLGRILYSTLHKTSALVKRVVVAVVSKNAEWMSVRLTATARVKTSLQERTPRKLGLQWVSTRVQHSAGPATLQPSVNIHILITSIVTKGAQTHPAKETTVYDAVITELV